MRSLGLAARYVSGYLSSANLIGGQASHAWVSVFFPGVGWLDLDPTNDQMADGSYVTLAWGRDYSDVAPVNGVAIGGGEHVINVSVAVCRRVTWRRIATRQPRSSDSTTTPLTSVNRNGLPWNLYVRRV